MEGGKMECLKVDCVFRHRRRCAPPSSSLGHPCSNVYGKVDGCEIIDIKSVQTMTGKAKRFSQLILKNNKRNESYDVLLGNAQFAFDQKEGQYRACMESCAEWWSYLKGRTIVCTIYDVEDQTNSIAAISPLWIGWKLDNGTSVWFMKNHNSRQPAEFHLTKHK